jgi:hypothetical protein
MADREAETGDRPMSVSNSDSPSRLPTGNEPPAQALLGYMKWFSEERWCAGWLIGLQTEMARSNDPAFNRLVEQAGGWWLWPDGADGVVFRPGSLAELRAS